MRILRADQAERHLGHGLAGNHGLGALAGIAADEAVDLGGRAGRNLLDQQAVLLARGDLETDAAKKILRGEVEPGEVGLDVGRQLMHAVVEAQNGDAPVVVMERRENACQDAQRVLRGTAKNARMQVAVGTGEPHFLVDQTPQRGRDRRRRRIPHTGVADQCKVEPEFFGVIPDEAE